MKSNEELNTIKEEVENANKQRRMLTDEELEQVSGGASPQDDNRGNKKNPAIFDSILS